MDDVATGPRAPTAAELAEDEGFEAFISGARIDDCPYREVVFAVYAVAWKRGWLMAAQYYGR